MRTESDTVRPQTLDRGTDGDFYRQVCECLYQEAWLLDEAHFEQWLMWLSPEIRYWMPTRFVRKSTEFDREYSTYDDGVAFLDEDYEALRMRVEKMRHRMSWTDNPSSRTIHAISNVQVESVADGRCVIRSVATVDRSRFANQSDRWVVRRVDTVNIEEDDWKLEERRIYYPSPVLESSNLAILF